MLTDNANVFQMHYAVLNHLEQHANTQTCDAKVEGYDTVNFSTCCKKKMCKSKLLR